MDVPHSAFNHTPYRMPAAMYETQPNPSVVSQTSQVQRIPENLDPGPPPLPTPGVAPGQRLTPGPNSGPGPGQGQGPGSERPSIHPPSVAGYGMPWANQTFQPKGPPEERNQHEHVIKEDVSEVPWPDVKSPIPESKQNVKSKAEMLPIDVAEEEVVSNFVPLRWSKSPKPHTVTKTEPEATTSSCRHAEGEAERRTEEELAAINAFMSVEPSGFTCVQCGHVVHRSQLVKHIRMHTADRPFKCEVCKRAFRQKSNLIVHMRMHTGELPFKCEYCDKAFRQKSILVTHVRTHTREMPYKCHLCPKAFTQKSNLVEHIRVHTGEKPYRCPECDKAFAQKSNLVVHIRSHTGEAPFKCGACGKAFRQKSILTTHMRTHTGELPFKCMRCDRAFAQKSNLVEHERQHTGERPFICRECNKAFIRHQDLLQHNRQHTGRKPYDCAECGKMFSRKKHAEKHYRTHLKHRFVCQICGQGFMDENLMVIHLTTHSHCHICSVSFDSKDDLTEHCRLHALGMPDSEEVHKAPPPTSKADSNSDPGQAVPAPAAFDNVREYPGTSKSFSQSHADLYRHTAALQSNQPAALQSNNPGERAATTYPGTTPD